MDTLVKHYHSLLQSPGRVFSRQLSGQIDWENRLICIKGFRGVGKTSFLLDHIRSLPGNEKSALYVNLNNFYFTRRRLFSFADEFSKLGGKILFLDQISKYPGWSGELCHCYEKIPDLRIVFTAYPVLRITDANPELGDIVKLYHLNGLSFREYLNIKTGESFQPLSLETILNDHLSIACKITSLVKPLAYFHDYLVAGYYPYFAETGDFYSDLLLKNINLSLEIDIPYVNQVEQKYLPKLRKLLYIIASETPLSPNVSKLASAIDTSRATVMNYLQHLRNARLINLLYYNGEEDHLRKPAKIFMYDTNILHTVMPDRSDNQTFRQTFFVNQVGILHGLKAVSDGGFLVDERWHFTIGGRKTEPATGGYCAADMIETGKENKIPLWLFGFLY